MCSKEDVLSWDNDIDLDELLGDYTDHEDKDSAENQCPPEVPSYQCPDCKKILKSISGFRGHMTKQHKKSRTKASDHRVTQKAKEDHRSPAAATLVDFEKICSEASKKTLEKMCNNPMYKLFGDNRMEVLARFCSDTDFLDAFFLNKLKDIFSLSLCDSSERELFFSRIHELRLSSCVQSECVNLFSEKGCEEKREDIINFLQDYILEIPSEILGGLLKENKKVSEELSYQISTNDQTILFYISGFIVANLRKKCYRMSKENRSERLNLLDKLTSKTSSTNFVAKYDQWLTKNSRGGLVRPADKFYLLVRELEISIRKIVDFNDIQCETLNTCKMKEHMMDSFMVNHYLKKLFHDCVNKDLSALLEDIVSVFLTVRGYAVARVLRNKLSVKQAKQTAKQPAKQSDSLRQVLKQCSTNL